MRYTRDAFDRLADPAKPVALAEIPLDAPMPDELTVAYWSELSHAWVSPARWAFEQVHQQVSNSTKE